MRSSARRRALAAEPDPALVAAAAGGNGDAFAELYRRHAPAAWGVAQSVVRNREDSADAVAEAFAKVFRALPEAAARSRCLPFRAYLLRASRHAAIDIVRRRSQVDVAGDMEDDAGEDRSGTARPRGPAESALAGEDRELIAEAFARLPSRWRTALWLIEVERMSTREVGAVLGVAPNNAAQLAARARGRLREHYLQAHVGHSGRPGCRESVASMGSYLAGSAARRQRSRLDDHLSGCADCRHRMAQVEDLGLTLRGILLPAPLLLRDRVRRAWELRPQYAVTPRFGASPAVQSLLDAGPAQPVSTLVQSGQGVATLSQRLSVASPAVERLVLGTSAGVLAVGATTLALGGPPPAAVEGRGPVAAAAPFSPVSSAADLRGGTAEERSAQVALPGEPGPPGTGGVAVSSSPLNPPSPGSLAPTLTSYGATPSPGVAAAALPAVASALPVTAPLGAATDVLGAPAVLAVVPALPATAPATVAATTDLLGGPAVPAVVSALPATAPLATAPLATAATTPLATAAEPIAGLVAGSIAAAPPALPGLADPLTTVAAVTAPAAVPGSPPPASLLGPPSPEEPPFALAKVLPISFL